MVEFRDDMAVRYVSHMGDDLSILEDARTSLRRPGRDSKARDGRSLTDRDQQRLRDFFALRHASVLRGCVLKVEVEVPIFVQRQLRTHWVGMAQSWNENDWLGFNDQSGRYSRQSPQFWLPRATRLEIEGFDPMVPTFETATPPQHEAALATLREAYEGAYRDYRRLLAQDVAREQARAVLPEGLYVAGRITANINAWFGLLSLRVDHPENAVATHPQAEVQQVAEAVGEIISRLWPEAFAAWSKTGRRRP
jgi:thymidylate synthase (FAD)